MKRPVTVGCDFYILLIAEAVVTIVYTCLPPAVLIICAPAGIPVSTHKHPLMAFPIIHNSPNLFNRFTNYDIQLSTKQLPWVLPDLMHTSTSWAVLCLHNCHFSNPEVSLESLYDQWSTQINEVTSCFTQTVIQIHQFNGRWFLVK